MSDIVFVKKMSHSEDNVVPRRPFRLMDKEEAVTHAPPPTLSHREREVPIPRRGGAPQARVRECRARQPAERKCGISWFFDRNGRLPDIFSFPNIAPCERNMIFSRFFKCMEDGFSLVLRSVPKIP